MPDHERSRGGQRAVSSVPATPIDESRLAMLRNIKRMTIEQRIDLLESLARDAAWARGARRVK